MTDEKRELIHQSAHRLRNRMTFVTLCADLLKLDLRDVLTREHEQEFERLDRLLQETQAVLNTLLRQLEFEPRITATTNGDASCFINGRIDPDSAT